MNASADEVFALAAHRRRIDGLCRWLAQQVPAGTPIERLETHLSTVLLCGDSAYKLKKPLAPGFVDFRSLADREHFIREELRLNRRLAPGVYRHVRPLLGSDESPTLGEPAPEGADAIDWVLEMRRFDPADGFDALARRGELTAAMVDELADRLAGFHAALPPADARLGEPAAAWPWVAQTLALVQQLGEPADQPRIAALDAWTRQRFQAQRPLMQARHDTGWVREGHGDLHLANIARIDGHATPFDALEFNATLRCVDIVDDLAFPFMDLIAHGLPHLAWRLVNRWVDATGDHAGLALLQWYAVQRALVRTKVALLAAAEPGADAAARPGRIDTARRYLSTAEQLAQRRPCHLAVVWGLSGSGKSTVAGMLAETLGAIRLRSDVERKRLHGLRPHERPADPAQLYSAEAGLLTYERLGELSARLLDAGLRVVVDAACLKRAERQALRRIAEERGAAWHLLACEAPDRVLRERIAARGAAGTDASDATLDVLTLQQGWIESLDLQEQAGAASIDTAVSPGALAGACRRLATDWEAWEAADPPSAPPMP